MQNWRQIHCSILSVILNATATQYTCSLNGVYSPHWLAQWSHHCWRMCIPVYSPCYVSVVQTILIILTLSGLFQNQPCIIICCSFLLESHNYNFKLGGSLFLPIQVAHSSIKGQWKFLNFCGINYLKTSNVWPFSKGVYCGFLCSRCSFLFYYYFLGFIYLCLEGGRTEEEEKHRCIKETSLVACHTPPAGDLAHNLGMCPDWELNSQASFQSTEPHWPGL